MRTVAVMLGGLLLIGGGALVVVSDQQRVAALQQVQQEVDRAERRLAQAKEGNLLLAERLTALRSQIAEQDAALSDTSGFLP